MHWVRCTPTFDFLVVRLGVAHQQGSCLSIQGVRWVGVAQELREEDLEDVYQVEHRTPCLVDDVETDGSRPAQKQMELPVSVFGPISWCIFLTCHQCWGGTADS